MKKKILFAAFAISGILQSYAQAQGNKQLNDIVNDHATEEYNSKLTSYFRAVADHITSSNSGYTLKMSLITLKDPSKWEQDVDFLKKSNRFLRYTEVNGGVNLNQQQSVSAVNLGMVFTLLNRRDSAVYVYRSYADAHIAGTILQDAEQKYETYLMNHGKTSQEANTIATKAFESVDLAGAAGTEKIDKNFIPFLDHATYYYTHSRSATFIDFYTGWCNDFDLFAKAVQRRPLLTLYPSCAYDYPHGAFSKAGAGSDFLVALNRNPKQKPWEIAATLTWYEQDDTATAGIGLEQSIGDFSVGINKILLENSKGQSQMELKFSGDFRYKFNDTKNQSVLTANATFKYKLFRSVWLPVQISYDPKNGNLFGFISITANFMPSGG